MVEDTEQPIPQHKEKFDAEVFEQEKIAAIKHLLRLQAVELDESNETEKQFIQFLIPRYLDRRMLKALPPLSIDVLPEGARKLLQETINEVLLPLIVYSSSALPILLKGGGYHMGGFTDLSCLFNANQISRLNGDRALRRYMHELHQLLQKVASSQSHLTALVAWSGDEAASLIKTDLARELFQEALGIKAADGAAVYISQQLHLFEHEKKIVTQPIQFAIKDEDENVLLENRPEFTNDGLESRIERLSRMHPELGKYIDHFSQKFTSNKNQLSRVVYMLENALYDPLLQHTFEKVEQKYKEDNKPVSIRGYKDIVDFSEHMEEDKADHVLFRVDFPGLMKLVNDYGAFKYKGGNALIKEIVSLAAEELVNFGCSNIKVMRRGVDVYLAVPQADLLNKGKKLDEVRNTVCTLLHTKFQNKYAVIQEKEGVIDAYIQSGEPKSPLQQGSSVHLLNCVVDSIQLVTATNEEKAVGVEPILFQFDFLDEKIRNGTENLLASLIRQLKNREGVKDFERLVFSITHYLNPYSKRGNIYLQDYLGLGEADVSALMHYYLPDPQNKTNRLFNKDEEENFITELFAHIQKNPKFAAALHSTSI